MPGSGKLTITGQLGDVMRESAQAALSLRARRRRASSLPSSTERLVRRARHPRPRPGRRGAQGRPLGRASRWPTALASLLSGRPVRNDVAMTGEITLTGQVLPIGGLKEKSLAAQRAGIKRVIVPDRNEGDVAEIPEQRAAGPRVRLRERARQAPALEPRGARAGPLAEALGRLAVYAGREQHLGTERSI